LFSLPLLYFFVPFDDLPSFSFFPFYCNLDRKTDYVI
jgi:hypothetical protein